ncbi:MAG: DNA replication/repair protein RecF [Chloroflexi bacterium]|nr:DNA replication/repair protein RecF [Chloroflexota bacterium]
MDDQAITLTVLRLRSFRNYREEEVHLQPGANLFLGDNAQGKTNLLEAVHVLAVGRSHRTPNLSEVIAWDAEGCSLQGEVSWGSEALGRIQVCLDRRGGKRVSVPGSLDDPRFQQGSIITVVVFSPDDLTAVKGPPVNRRRMLDNLGSQLSRKYRRESSRYYRIVQQRNALLRKKGDSNLLEPLEQQLCQSGSELVHFRRRLVTRLGELSAGYHGRMSGERLSLVYDTSLPGRETPAETAVDLRRQLAERRGEEQARGVTLAGPHRDDLQVKVEGSSIRPFGSQGQQRTAVLALKLAEAELLSEGLHRRPLLLLDDVFSELDMGRRSALLDLVEDLPQVVVTATGEDSVPSDLRKRSTVFRVAGGRVEGVKQ